MKLSSLRTSEAKEKLNVWSIEWLDHVFLICQEESFKINPQGERNQWREVSFGFQSDICRVFFSKPSAEL